MELLDNIGDIPDLKAQLWYLDDGTFIGSRDAVSSLLNSLVEKGPEFGIYVNMSKCEVFWPSGDQDFPTFDSRVRRININSSGSELLGSPIVGTDTFFDEFFKARVDYVLDAQSHLSDLDDPQVEIHLLRSCMSICKLNHLLRTTPPDKVAAQLLRFDEGLRHSLQTILRSSIPDTSWLQATLPIRMGGFGLREAHRTAPAAFLGSCNSTRHLAWQLISNDSQFLASPPVTYILHGENLVTTEMKYLLGQWSAPFTDTSQHGLQGKLDASLLSSIKSSSSLRDQARLSTLASPHSGSWLRAIPNPKLGLSMNREEFVTASRVWLGLSLFPSPPNAVRCTCDLVLDKFGDHLLGCGRRALRTKRHNYLRDIVFHHLLSDDSGCKLEQGCSTFNYKKPGDIFHPDFLDGLPAYFDITVRNSLLPQFITVAATCPGAAADAGEREKDKKHNDDVTHAGALFYPLVVESLGFWSAHSLETLKIIAKRAALHNNITVSQSVCNLHEQLSVCLWKNNARLILDRQSLEGSGTDCSC